MGKVKRNIKFYSVTIGKKYRTDDQESIMCLKDKKEIAYAVINGFERINKLPFNFDVERAAI